MASLLDLALPPRLVLRALDDLHVLAVAAQEGVALLRDLDRRATEVQGQLDQVLTLGGRIEDHAQAILAMGGELGRLGEQMVGSADAVVTRAGEVNERVVEIMAALPLLERAVQLGEPLEGAVERLGRIVDRLPGGPAARKTR